MYKIIDNTSIPLSHTSVSVDLILDAIISTNKKLQEISAKTRLMSFDIFNILDLRTLSGAVGETFVGELSLIVSELRKNPSIDGYPDLVQCTTPEMISYFDDYASKDSKEPFAYGGIEVKNTFGYKKTGTDLLPGEQRIQRINHRLEWKAHHQKTNHLLGLFSDYINGVPTIIAAFYSDELVPSDWTVRAEPEGDSAMTSFSTLEKSGFEKMLKGIKICLDDKQYLAYFGLEA
ncbi:hypothetical protein ACQRCQ_00045 [Lachnospiraceae bacterium SGI.085]